MTEKHNWGVHVKDIGHTYEGLPWDFGHYVGEGRRFSELTKEPYLRSKVKAV